MHSQNPTRPNLEEIRLGELFRIIWRRKWIILSGTVVFGAAAALAAYLAPKKYEADIVLSPVSSSPGNGQLGGLSSLASQFGGIASLAGLQLGGDSRKAETLAVLQSQALTEKYIADNHLLPVLFSKLWDPVHRSWKVSDPKQTPTLWTANEFFRGKIRTVVLDPKTGLVTMSITWTDPALASEWANGLVRMTNDYLREKAINESERNITYLTDQAAKTDVVGVRQAIYSILQNEINKVMLARGSDEYALKVVDPASPPERPSSPRPLLWTAAGCLGGALLAMIIAITRPLPAARPRLPQAVEAASS